MTHVATARAAENLHIDKSVFRAYDIRGVVDKNLTEHLAFQLGLSFGSAAHDKNVKQVVVARDGRLTGERLMANLKKGLAQTGMEVIDIGMMPTPVLYFACEHFKTYTGIMITGSHNPADYNGFKMVLDGLPLAEKSIEELYDRIKNQQYAFGEGSMRTEDITQAYIQAVCSEIQITKPLKVVVDCGNGVVGAIAEKFFTKLGVEFIGLYCDVDGNFPNHHPDPGQPTNLQDLMQAVKQHKADLGLAFDGDGDRLGIVTNQGEIVWPDRLMMLFVKAVLEAEPNSKIIYDIKCSHHLGHYIKKLGGEPVMYKTGHSLIKRKMKELSAPLAGEMSGHFFFKHRWFGFDDACFSAAMLLEILSNDARARVLSEMVADLATGVCTPEINVAILDSKKFTFIEQLKALQHFNDAKIITVDGLRVEFDYGWGLVRASNTTPNLVLRFEGNSEADLTAIQQSFKEAMLKVDASLSIPF